MAIELATSGFAANLLKKLKKDGADRPSRSEESAASSAPVGVRPARLGLGATLTVNASDAIKAKVSKKLAKVVADKRKADLHQESDDESEADEGRDILLKSKPAASNPIEKALAELPVKNKKKKKKSKRSKTDIDEDKADTSAVPEAKQEKKPVTASVVSKETVSVPAAQALLPAKKTSKSKPSSSPFVSNWSDGAEQEDSNNKEGAEEEQDVQTSDDTRIAKAATISTIVKPKKQRADHKETTKPKNENDEVISELVAKLKAKEITIIAALQNIKSVAESGAKKFRSTAQKDEDPLQSLVLKVQRGQLSLDKALQFARNLGQRRIKTKTRSKQKNLKKDTRAPDQKPNFRVPVVAE